MSNYCYKKNLLSHALSRSCKAYVMPVNKLSIYFRNNETSFVASSHHTSHYLTASRSHAKPGPMVISCALAVEETRSWKEGWQVLEKSKNEILQRKCTRAVTRELVPRISRDENLGLSVSIGDAAVHAASLVPVKKFFSPGERLLKIYDRRNYHRVLHHFGS